MFIIRLSNTTWVSDAVLLNDTYNFAICPTTRHSRNALLFHSRAKAQRWINHMIHTAKSLRRIKAKEGTYEWALVDMFDNPVKQLERSMIEAWNVEA